MCRLRVALYAEGMTRPLTAPLTIPGLVPLHRAMVLAVLTMAVPLVTVARLVDPVTAQPHWLDVTGSVVMWPLLLGGLWWVWRSMDGMKLTPRMPLAWQMLGASMFALVRVVVLMGVLSAVLGLMDVAITLHAQERMPEELVTFGVSVLVGMGATFLLDGSAGRGSLRN